MTPNAVEVYVSRVRAKLADAALIRTVRGLGYRPRLSLKLDPTTSIHRRLLILSAAAARAVDGSGRLRRLSSLDGLHAHRL